MFIDYYQILDISKTDNHTIIKSAYKKQAIIWHPDKNKSQDATSKMQLINEAYIILSDVNAKYRYDLEYDRYFKIKKERENIVLKKENKDTFENDKSNKNKQTDFDFEIHDDILRNLINTAKLKAKKLAQETKDDFISLTKAFLKGFIERKF